MLIALLLLASVGFCFFMSWIGDYYNDWPIGGGVMAGVLTLYLIIWGAAYVESINFTKGWPAFKATVEEARPENPLEAFALRERIADLNADLRQAQYWNTVPILNDFVYDPVMELEPIE